APHGDDPRRGAHGAPGHSAAADPLRLPRRPDRLSRAALRRKRLDLAVDPEGPVPGLRRRAQRPALSHGLGGIPMKRGIAIAFGLLFASAGLVASEQADTLSHAGCAAPGDPVDPALLERPTVLRKDVGAVHQKVTTSSSEAQAFYDQGLMFLHHYVFIEAARSFHQALRSDPECAMCWMGLARAEQGLERREATAAAIEKAQALAALEAKASKKEQTFIALRAQQIEAQAAPSSEE